MGLDVIIKLVDKDNGIETIIPQFTIQQDRKIEEIAKEIVKIISLQPSIKDAFKSGMLIGIGENNGNTSLLTDKLDLEYNKWIRKYLIH